MNENLDILNLLYRKVSVMEMIEKFKSCGLVWSKIAPSTYKTTHRQNGVFWELLLTKTQIQGSLVSLDFRKDGSYFFTIKSDQESYLVIFFDELEGDESYTRDKEILDTLSVLRRCNNFETYDPLVTGGLTIALTQVYPLIIYKPISNGSIGPSGLAVDAVGGKIYVAGKTNNTIRTIDASTDTVINTYNTTNTTGQLSFAYSNKLYSIAENSSILEIIDVSSTPANVANLNFNSQNHKSVAYDSNLNMVYVVRVMSNDISYLRIIDPSSNSLTRTVSIPNSSLSGEIVVNPNTGLIYLSDFWRSKIWVVSPWDNYNVIGFLNCGYGAKGMAIDANNNILYCCNSLENTISVIDIFSIPNTFTTIVVNAMPLNISLNTVSKRGYIATMGYFSNYLTNVDCISLEDYSVVGVLFTGKGPIDLKVNSVTNKIYVSNFIDDTISVIDGPTGLTLATL
jgi:DNA-binding beta-propeller fold protein YncE